MYDSAGFFFSIAVLFAFAPVMLTFFFLNNNNTKIFYVLVIICVIISVIFGGMGLHTAYNEEQQLADKQLVEFEEFKALSCEDKREYLLNNDDYTDEEYEYFTLDCHLVEKENE